MMAQSSTLYQPSIESGPTPYTVLWLSTQALLIDPRQLLAPTLSSETLAVFIRLLNIEIEINFLKIQALSVLKLDNIGLKRGTNRCKQ